MANKLLGKTIVDVKIASDKLAMLFVTQEGEQVIVRVDADCCSNTWIENVEMPALGLPFIFVSEEYLEMPDHGDSDEYTTIQYYGSKVITDKGEMIIDYRNESNGYYGGSIEWPDTEHGRNFFYGGVYGQNNSNNDWMEIE